MARSYVVRGPGERDGCVMVRHASEGGFMEEKKGIGLRTCERKQWIMVQKEIGPVLYK